MFSAKNLVEQCAEPVVAVEERCWHWVDVMAVAMTVVTTMTFH